jgi:3-oxoacyl-(acyl-carrier-protein) synthase
MNIYITGMGCISALGSEIDQTLYHLKNQKSGLTYMDFVETEFSQKFMAGEIKMSNQDLGNRLAVTGKLPTRTSLLGLWAAQQAVSQSGIEIADKFYKTGFISASTVGGMVNTERHFQNFLKGTNQEHFVTSNDMGDSTEYIANVLKIKNFVTTINTACASSMNAIILGTRMIKQGILDRVIVGGTDSLCKFTINGFNALMLLDTEACLPFDARRKGINLGEGAAYLVIESENVIKDKDKILAKISGFGSHNDAFHQTASSPNGYGLQLAMNAAMKTASLTTKDINYLNAHGTATPNNDLTEGWAIKETFTEGIAFSSTKSFTGHTLAASGSIEAIFSILAINNNFMPANLGFSEAIEEHGLIPISTTQKGVSLKHVMSNSAGMGGSCSSIIFSKT